MKCPSITSAEDIHAALWDMRLSAMAAAFEEDMKNPNSNLKTFTERFSDIIRAEQDYRKNRKTNKYLKYAHLKMPDADLADFDMSVNRQLDIDVLTKLSTCDWIRNRLNVIVTGPCGCGKTWISSALGVRACENFMTVRFYPTNRLILRMKIYTPDLYLQKLNEIQNLDLLILDDIGLQNYDLDSCRIFYEILDARYKNGSTLLISQFPVSAWSDLFADKTYGNGVLSRNIENSIRMEITGDDLRLNHKANLTTE